MALSQQALAQAIALLQQQVPGLQLQAPRTPGRRGDWLAYGPLVLARDAPENAP